MSLVKIALLTIEGGPHSNLPNALNGRKGGPHGNIPFAKGMFPKLASLPQGPHLELPISHLKEDHKELKELEDAGKKISRIAKDMQKEDAEGKKKYFVRSEKDEHC